MKNFSLKAKLISLSIFLLSISVIMGGVGYWALGKVITQYSVISDVSYPNTSTLMQMFSNYRYARIEALHIASDDAPDAMKEKALEIIAKNVAADKGLHEKYMAIDFLPGEAPLYEAFRKGIDESYANLVEVAELYKKNKNAEPNLVAINAIMFGKVAAVGKKLREDSLALRTFHADQAAIAVKNAKEAGDMANKLSLGLIIGLGLLGITASILFANTLSKALKEISDALDESSTQVSSAAGQIASSSEELSQAATEQAASLEETSASVEEMSSMVSINSENAKKASDSSSSSQKQAERGRQVVEEMVQSMAQINESNNNIMDQINHSNEQMSEIVKVIQEIGNKTKVINDIVFQTKLLSFNASVEAARAGEQGKGFAVVAEEVGNLAQMSGNAAKEISDMLTASVHKVEGIVNETKSKVEVLIVDGKEKVKVGTRVAEECGAVLAEIVTNVSSVTIMASEISNASLEQSKGIQEITKAMGQLDQVTQTNSATSEEAASAAEELSAQADSLKNQVLTLVAVINGAGKGGVAQAPTTKMETKVAKTKPTTNVLPMKKAEPKKAKVASAPVATAAPMKKAAGGGGKDGGLPSYDHPGFEEV